MTEKKTYRKLDADDPRLRLAGLLYRYLGSEEACEKAGLPTDKPMRQKLSKLNPQYGWKKLPLALEPISHVTLIADGWEPFNMEEFLCKYRKVNFQVRLNGDQALLFDFYSTTGQFALTIGDLRAALNSLSL